MKPKVIKIVSRVWLCKFVDGEPPGRLTALESSFLAALFDDGKPRTSLDSALEYLGLHEDWNRAGRPSFGGFSRWWAEMEMAGRVAS